MPHGAPISEAIRLRRELEAKKDELAGAVYALVGRFLGDPEAALPEASQLQNLCSLAASTDSLEELRIFIRYQMSRGERKPIIPVEFGKDLLAALPPEMETARVFL